ncbi:nucleotide-binding universal stress UspA family protein [Bacillus pakistanensis]|uniref:Universal stress protein n=1 Tax=Rossellomorea pakistanensis TaxID=992288 RepID=A0ABS2NAV6_9BACI|nr:universal stress protein [Bacillus pakistanensis]MBM7584949.1 nucleotide-binding universal stress UspA family protein [Bacillus pakistanensis]
MSLYYRNILVAVDGSIEAEWAFKKAIAIAKRNDANITLIHVIDSRSFATVESYDRTTVGERAETYAEDVMAKYKKEAELAGVLNVQTLIEYGSPKVIIPNEGAKKANADLIICGATGLNAVERFLIGSVSEHITRSAECDVLVVRNEKEE